MGVAAGRGERLNRFLARRGVASRRGADQLIASGRVRLNGATAAVGAVIDSDTDVVSVDGTVVEGQAPRLRSIALHKPAGVVSTMHDPQGRPTVASLAPDVPGLVPVGRLDGDSRGLLLLTNDGDLAHRVAHPRHGVRKTYRVRCATPLEDAALERLLRGVNLEDGPARILAWSRVSSDARRVDVVMGEGRKREVRRLFAALGASVDDLCRIAVGPVRLGRLAEGAWRELSAAELASLRREVGG
ncbi:MAG: pseudouridine synthase [Candidatus Dormibacteria bacterium]